ncbi:MAG: DUF177 domain-containing protein [Pseudomonadota bacterium]
MTDAAPVPEYSVVVELADLSKNGRIYALEPKSEERLAIAHRLGVADVASLSGELRVSASKQKISVSGRLRARLARQCVASLEDMLEDIDEPVDLEFLRSFTPARDDDDAVEEMEVHEGAVIDIGELLVQQLSLAMSPFPRKPGARSLVEDYGSGGRLSPFSELLDRKIKSNKNQ